MNARHEDLLVALTRKVRLLTLDQVRRGWWPTASAEAMTQSLSILEKQRLIEPRTVHAQPLLDLQGPLFVWRPGDPDPDPGKIAYLTTSRWRKSREPIPTTVYVASRRSFHRFAGIPRPNPARFAHQCTHDLHMSAIYMRFRSETPDLAEAWVGEDVLAPHRRHQKLPDAVLADDDLNIHHVIEFCGRYDTRRVAEDHAYCKKEGFSYESW